MEYIAIHKFIDGRIGAEKVKAQTKARALTQVERNDSEVVIITGKELAYIEDYNDIGGYGEIRVV